MVEIGRQAMNWLRQGSQGSAAYRKDPWTRYLSIHIYKDTEACTRSAAAYGAAPTTKVGLHIQETNRTMKADKNLAEKAYSMGSAEWYSYLTTLKSNNFLCRFEKP